MATLFTGGSIAEQIYKKNQEKKQAEMKPLMTAAQMVQGGTPKPGSIPGVPITSTTKILDNSPAGIVSSNVWKGSADQANFVPADAGNNPTSSQISSAIKPTVATKSNPVIDRTNTTQSNTTYTPGGTAQFDDMSDGELKDYIDWIDVQSKKRSLTEEEQLSGKKVARLLQERAIKPASNPYDPLIATKQSEREAKSVELDAQLDEALAKKQQELDAVYAQKEERSKEASKRKAAAQQGVLSFSGFGRSTYAVEKATEIQEELDENLNILEEQKKAELERFKLERAGANAKLLEGLDSYINTLGQKSAEFIGNAALKVNELNAQTSKSFEERMNNIANLSSMFGVNTKLTPQDEQVVNSVASFVLDSSGNINSELMKNVPTYLQGNVYKKAAEMKIAKENKLNPDDIQLVQGDKDTPFGYFNKKTLQFVPLDKGRAFSGNGGGSGGGMGASSTNIPSAVELEWYNSGKDGVGKGKLTPERYNEIDSYMKGSGTSPLVNNLKKYQAFLDSHTWADVQKDPALAAQKDNYISQITADYKQEKKLGTLDAGVQKLIDGLIGNKGLSYFSNAAQSKAVGETIKSYGYDPTKATNTTTTQTTTTKENQPSGKTALDIIF